MTLSLALMLSVTGLWAQKAALTHQDYDQWESIGYPQLSRTGKFVATEVEPQVGDGYLYVGPVTADPIGQVPRGHRPYFTSTEDFVLYTIVPQYDTIRALKLEGKKKDEFPKDTLAIMSLPSGSTEYIARVQSFKVPSEGGAWAAWLMEAPEEVEEEETDSTEAEDGLASRVFFRRGGDEPKGFELVVRNLSSGDEYRLDRVEEYAWAKSGSRLAVVRPASTDSTDDAGIWVFNTRDLAWSPVDTGKVEYPKMAWDEAGNQLAYMATPDSADAEIQTYSLHYWTAGKVPQQLVTTATAGLPQNWWVSKNGNLRFSENGSRIMFGTAPMPVKYTYEEDTTRLDEERPGVDVWHWNDLSLQPQQLLDRGREEKRTYMAVYHLKTKNVVQLEDPSLEAVFANYNGNANVWLGVDDRPHRLETSWAYPWKSDVYTVDVNTGQRTRVYQGSTDWVQISPQGKYLYWFEAADSNWMAYDVTSKKLRNLTANLPYPVWDVEDDHPMLPGSFGSSYWTEDDAKFWVYDQYDIWALDPTGATEPVRLTQGRDDKVRYRAIRLNYNDEPFLPKKAQTVLSSIDTETKETGLHGLDPRRGTVTTWVSGKFDYGDVVKPAESDQLVFTKASFELAPQQYGADWGLQNQHLLIASNPQQGEYKWGTAELTEFRSLDGVELKGIIYKPEDFDPSKKYPMIVYFYEKSSDRLYSYQRPRPSASTIIFPWAVSNDYVVFVPDIVYKDGQPGPSAYNCIVAGTQHMIAQGYINPNKIGLQGQSWGGYQTAYLVTRTEMYAAASAGAPVSNMTSAYGGIRWGSGLSRMFQYERTQSRIGGTLWENRDEYIENSPVFFADRITTPLLIMHNDEDGAVPWYQGIELFVAMRRLRQPAYMLVYNGEAHNLRERRNPMDLSMRMGQFFNHYLKDEPMPLWMSQGIPAVDKGRYLGYELEKEDELLEEDK